MMNRVFVFILVYSLTLPQFLLSAQEQHHLTVANWSFDIIGAVKGPTIAGVVHLGALEDRRDWLVVTLSATNTSSETQELHSDRIRLQTGGELVKQTGAESEAAAKEMDFRTIGGPSKHKIEAGETWNIVQVFKVDPEAADFTLIFDEFQGKWEVPITTIVEDSTGDSRALLGEDVEGSADATPSSDADAWMIRTGSFQITLIGAAVAPTFSGPFHLGILDDGRSWLVVTYKIHNTTGEKVEVKSDSVRIISTGKEIKQAGDETRSVAGELKIDPLTVKLEPDESRIVVQVFKISPEDEDNTLKVSGQGDWYLNLRPIIDSADGNANAVVPESAPDITKMEIDESEINAIPTVVPTPTSEPTPVPTLTPIPTATTIPTVTPIPTATVPPPPPTARALPAYYEVADEDLQQVARPRWVVRIVIPEGSQEQIVAACANAVDSYLALGSANVVVVFGYESYDQIDGQFTRCRSEGTSDGLGHTGDGTFNMFNSQDDGRIQVETVDGQRHYVPRN